MAGVVLDDFTDVSGWLAVASGQAQLAIARDEGPAGAAMKLDFDFRGGGGFVAARKQLSLQVPEAYAFSFRIRGVAALNRGRRNFCVYDFPVAKMSLTLVYSLW